MVNKRNLWDPGSGPEGPPNKKLTTLTEAGAEATTLVHAGAKAEAPLTMVTGSDVVLARNVAAEHDEKEESQQEQSLTVNEDLEAQIGKIQQRIAEMEVYIISHHKTMSRTELEIQASMDLLAAVRNSESLDPIFNDKQYANVSFPVSKEQPRHEQQERLGSYIQDARLQIRELGKIILSLQKKTEDLEKEKQQLEDRAKSGVSLSKPKEATDAKQAASCGGMFSKVVCPFVQEVLFTDEGLVNTREMASPFYFLADWTSSNHGNTPKRVFLKVWKKGDVDVHWVQSEYDNHRQAYDAGVPVAAPVLDKLVWSTSSSGSEYLIFAVDYIRKDDLQNEKDFLQFCTSLFETVIQLHEKAGLLHCDIKPSNLCWSNRIVRLIDFGHSQPMNKATWSRGTEGYEAPEIFNDKMPCSIKTDAFSVGVTVLKVLEQLSQLMQQSHLCKDVRDIAVKLQDSDPDTRWSLPEALGKIRSIHRNEGSPPIDGKKFHSSPEHGVSIVCPEEVDY